MNTRTLSILIAFAAAAIAFGQWALVMANDDFTLHSPTNYKVFTYGFPFRIVECAPELPIRTPVWQVPLRFLGNFTAFLFVGLFILSLVRRIRQTARRHDDEV